VLTLAGGPSRSFLAGAASMASLGESARLELGVAARQASSEGGSGRASTPGGGLAVAVVSSVALLPASGSDLMASWASGGGGEGRAGVSGVDCSLGAASSLALSTG